MSSTLSWYIICIVMLNIIGCGVLLYFTRKNPKGTKNSETTGHSFDGIEELNNPLPRWWMWVFWMTIAFALAYLYFYPGLGSYQGKLNWSSHGQLREEQKIADAKFGPLFKKYGEMPFAQLIKTKEAMAMGERLFANNCALCHGSDARGARGFPNLTDSEWLYGGKPEIIEQTILHGRNGQMPPLGLSLGHDVVEDVVSYIFKLNGRKVDMDAAERGQKTFAAVCVACHGADAKGSEAMGAPNLVNNIWLYGGDRNTVIETVMHGRHGHMPAHEELLGKDKVHILAGYVYSLSQDK